MDLIKTIEEEDDINYESDESKQDENDDIRKPKKKKHAAKKKLKSDEFDSSFAFVTNQKEYMKDTWSDMSAYLRKKYKSTLDEKITKIRKERSTTEEVDIGNNEANGESDDNVNEESDSDDNEWDDVKTKNQDSKVNF